MITGPTTDQAKQFALMLSVGAPPQEAIRYFAPDGDDPAQLTLAFLTRMAEKWLVNSAVQNEIKRLQGGDWSDLTAEQRIKLALDKQYTEMAYYLYSRNYVDLTGNDKLKADTCRQALEAKLAGTAGKLNEVERFWADMAAGRIKLQPASLPAPLGGSSR